MTLLPFLLTGRSWPGVDAHCGGNVSAARDKLKNVRQIQASSTAFAAILGDGSVVTGSFAAIVADGSVVTWRIPSSGGDSSAVQDQLKNASQTCFHVCIQKRNRN